MAYIRKVKTTSGATAVQVAHKSGGKITRIKHIGSAHNELELDALIILAQQELNRNQLLLFDETDNLLPSEYIELKKSYSGLLFAILMAQYGSLGFNALNDYCFALLCIARIVEPTSKLDSIRVLSDLGVDNIAKDRLYRSLRKCSSSDYRTNIARLCVQRSLSIGIALVLYDVTTLYFEIQEEDEYRKPGMSKERRLEPQIVVGLLVDQDGFPLGVHSFEGNKAETKTILPVIEEFCKQNNISGLTVVADAAMMSLTNLKSLTEAGFHYIVASRLNRIPYDIAEYQKTAPLTDNQIVTEQRDGYRIVYQYKQKRANLDIRNIDKQVIKAQKIINGIAPAKKAKFLTVKTREKSLNEKLIDKAKTLAGIKGYVTNLDISDEQVIEYYHQLFQVEASFRMAKSDLKARPIFHHKRESIDAHLTIVFAALAIGRSIETITGVSIKHFVKTVRPIRSGIISIQGKEYVAKPNITDIVRNWMQLLRSGH